jgi:hypothetical protein
MKTEFTRKDEGTAIRSLEKYPSGRTSIDQPWWCSMVNLVEASSVTDTRNEGDNLADLGVKLTSPAPKTPKKDVELANGPASTEQGFQK